jgi:type II secretory pathway pseudopilin PulG
MGMQKQSGFTVVEVMLYLGITALLAVSLLGGWTAMIDTQRYHDSVKTTQAFLQKQYNLVYDVDNGRDPSLDCTNGVVGNSSGQPVGQSDCVLMGRYVYLDQTGQNFKVFSVIGTEAPVADGTADLTAIKAYNPIRSTFSLGVEDNELLIPWQATVVDPHSDVPRGYVIAIIRAPLTGTVHSFVESVGSPNFYPDFSVIGTGLLQASREASDTKLCLNPGANFVGGRLGVVLKAHAESQSFVQTIGDAGGTC